MDKWYGVEINLCGGPSIYLELPVDDLRRLENDWSKVRTWKLDQPVTTVQTFQGRERTYRFFKTEDGVGNEVSGYKSKTVHVDLTEVTAIEVTEVVEGDED